tara:strand:- start:16808 stop:17341 length:534 start_codon:yes stop_codon:yes gene_type:complete
MKTIINQELRLNNANFNDQKRQLLNDFNIFFKETPTEILIQEQKIVLNEIDMNTFFYEILFFNNQFDIDFSPLGGKGCEICFNIKNKEKLEDTVKGFYHVKTESGDEYMTEFSVPRENSDFYVKQQIVEDLWTEIEYWIIQENECEGTNLTKEYCLKDPNKALDISLLYPDINYNQS